jgi:hypothetical protein
MLPDRHSDNDLEGWSDHTPLSAAQGARAGRKSGRFRFTMYLKQISRLPEAGSEGHLPSPLLSLGGEGRRPATTTIGPISLSKMTSDGPTVHRLQFARANSPESP